MPLLTSSPAIAYLNLAKGKTITVSSANASFPGSNLSNSLLSGDGATWRSGNGVLTGVTVDADLESSQDVDIVALLGTNLTDSATRTPLSSEASNFSSPEYNPSSGPAFDLTYSSIISDIPDYGRHLIVLPGQTYNSRYWRFTLNDSGNPYNYLKAAVFWIGPIYQFNQAWTSDPQGLDSSSEPTFEFIGSPGIEKSLEGWKLVIKGLSEKSSRKILSIVKNKLRTGRLVVIPHPTDTKTFIHEIMYCTIVGFRRNLIPGVSLFWQVEIEFQNVED